MPISQKQIQQRSLRIASAVGTDPQANPVTDNAFLGEDLFREALKDAVIIEKFQRTFTLTSALGSVAIPDSVILAKLPTASIHPVATPGILASFEERYFDYQRAAYSQLAYFTVQGANLLYRAAGGQASAFNGDLSLTAIAMPDIPPAITTAMVMPATLADRCVEILARMIRG